MTREGLLGAHERCELERRESEREVEQELGRGIHNSRKEGEIIRGRGFQEEY